MLIEHITTRLTLELTSEKKLWTAPTTRKNDTFSSYVALDDVSVSGAAELDAIAALLADAWDNDLDPKVSAQLVQAKVQAYLSFRKEKGIKTRARVNFLFANHVYQQMTVDNNREN